MRWDDLFIHIVDIARYQNGYLFNDVDFLLKNMLLNDQVFFSYCFWFAYGSVVSQSEAVLESSCKSTGYVW